MSIKKKYKKRYELYECGIGCIHDLVFAKDDLNVVVDVMLALKEKMGGKYVIIDNYATPPINYRLLGFDSPIAKAFKLETALKGGF